MIDARYTELKRMLEVRRRDLQRSLDAKIRDLGANDGHDRERVGALDAAEASDSGLQEDIAITLTEMTAEVLGRVNEALARLASGVYGSCVECHGEISLKRLTALPFALRCRECEALRESGERRSRQFSAGRSHWLLRFDADSQE
jgi:RNA polymerase-binding transcription factor